MVRNRSRDQLRLPMGREVPAATHPAREPFVAGSNPRLVDFLQENRRSTRSSIRRPFEEDLVGEKTSALYTFHPYWSKKDPGLIRKYVLHHTEPGELVLDPFSGTGTTGLATLLTGRTAILVDASPSAALLSYLCCLPGSSSDVDQALQRLLSAAGAEVDSLFATKCDRCDGDATTEYVIYSERFQCPRCAELVALYDCVQVKVPYPVGGRQEGRTETKKRTVCPHCLARENGKPNRDFVISTRTKKFGAIPVLVRYRCQGRCKPAIGERTHSEDKRTTKARYFEKYDLGQIARIARAEIPDWYPTRKMMDVEDDFAPWGVKWRAGTSNFRNVADLYTRRNLRALAVLRRALGSSHLGRIETLLFTGLLHKCSHLMGCGADQVGRVKMGTYYIAPIRMECRPTKYLQEAASDPRRHFDAKQDSGYKGGAYLTSSADASHELSRMPTESIDYVFTDPPYVDKVQYGELNFVWEAWLGLDTSWLASEIIVNPFRNKDLDGWDASLRHVLAELFRILKPERWLSLCYHDTDPGTWARLQNMLLDAGFEIHTVTVMDSKQKSQNQLTAEKVVKSDLVLNCRKPTAGEARGNGGSEAALVGHRVRGIVVEALSTTAGQTRDRLWDLVLKRLLTRGQMAEHRFDDILAEVAWRSESGRYFLKEEFEALSESDLKNEEKAGDALVRFARLRCEGLPAALAAEAVLRDPQVADPDVGERGLRRYVRETLLRGKQDAAKFELGGRLKGAEFYDCLFFYLTRWLKGRGAGKTPRRNLADFLDEYLVRFKDGDKWLHRPPDEAEADSLRKARQTGLGRRIRQYVAFLSGEGDFPKERMPDAKTLVAWLKHCATFGLADEGVTIFEKGGLAGSLAQLSEDQRYDAEEYYATCRRKATRKSSDDSEAEDGDADEGDEE
jgi:DNA modification methylase